MPLKSARYSKTRWLLFGMLCLILWPAVLAAQGDQQVREAQELLRAAGFDPGPIDGMLGQKTRTALRRYQLKHGLPETGELDELTRKSLGLQVRTEEAKKQVEKDSKRLNLDQVREILKSRLKNFYGLDLNRLDLSKLDLRWADLSLANLTHANLTETNLSFSSLIAADLSGANLREANLISADLSKANLQTANLNDANLTEANLHQANLGLTQMQRANLTGANLSQAILVNADLIYANLTDVDLRAADLNMANLQWSNLAGADLSGGSLQFAMLEKARAGELELDHELIKLLRSGSCSYIYQDGREFVVVDRAGWIPWKPILKRC